MSEARRSRLLDVRLIGAICTILGLCLSVTPAISQVLYGSVVGVVKDSQGSTVPGATVTVVNKETNLTRETITNSEGAYSLANVPPGTYDVKVSLQGFREGVRSNVPVAIGQLSRVDMALEVGTVSETITVASEAQLLQTDKADVSTELKSAEMTAMPLNRFRNYQALLNLVPGTSPMAFGNAETDTPARSLATNVNGQANTNNSTRTDGATNMNIWLPNHNMYVSPAETIDSVNVSTSSFDAEQGMAGGGAVTVITKSGTNQFSGSGFEFFNSDRPECESVLFRPRCQAGQAAARGKHVRRDDWRTNRQEQALLLRVVRGLQADEQPSRRSSTCRTKRSAAVTSAERTNNAGTQQTIYNPFTGNANGTGRDALRQQPDSLWNDQSDCAEGHAALSAAEHHRVRSGRLDGELQARRKPYDEARQLRRQDQLEPHHREPDLGQVRLHECEGG